MKTGEKLEDKSEAVCLPCVVEKKIVSTVITVQNNMHAHVTLCNCIRL